MSGRASRTLPITASYSAAVCLPVHRLEDAIGARLEGEVQIRHELRLVAEQRDQLIVHVERVAGGEAEPLDRRHFGEPPQQLGERPWAPIWDRSRDRH